MMLTHHGTHDKLKLFHLEDGGFNHQRDYKLSEAFKQTVEQSTFNLNNTNSSFQDNIKEQAKQYEILKTEVGYNGLKNQDKKISTFVS